MATQGYQPRVTGKYAVLTIASRVRGITRGVHFTDANNLCRCMVRPKFGGAGVPSYNKQNVIGICRLN